MRRIRSLGNKVALLFFLITAAAFGVIYFWVVTQPESSLEERRLQDLELVADASTRSLERLQVGDSGQQDLDKQVRALAESTDARVTVLTVREDFEDASSTAEGLSFYRAPTRVRGWKTCAPTTSPGARCAAASSRAAWAASRVRTSAIVCSRCRSKSNGWPSSA